MAGLQGLAALVRDTTASGVGRRALLVRTELLPAPLSRPHHLRLARAALDPLTLADRARLHDLPGGRMAVSWRGDSPALLRQSLDALETLLQDSPLDAPGMPELVGLYDLPRDGAALLREAGVAAAAQGPPARAADPPAAPSAALDAGTLALVEDLLTGADVARFARRRAVCRLGPRGMQMAWERRFLSVPEIIASVAPGHSAEAGTWLFRRLTRLLDRRMLALLWDKRELREASPFSLHLNTGSILGPEFLKFDAALPAGLRGKVILDLLPADILSDPAGFALARGFAQARGYRIGLRAVSATLLPVLHLAALQVDYVRLRWSPGLAACKLPHGTARWVLSRADTPEAVGWGESAGIGLFEGAGAAPGALRPPPSALG